MKIEFQLRDVVRSTEWEEGGYCRVIEVRDRHVKLESLLNGKTNLCHKQSVFPDADTVSDSQRI